MWRITDRERERLERDGSRIVGQRTVPITQIHHVLDLERDCLECGQPFRVAHTWGSAGKRYCSNACRQRAYRKRKRGEQDATD